MHSEPGSRTPNGIKPSLILVARPEFDKSDCKAVKKQSSYIQFMYVK